MNSRLEDILESAALEPPDGFAVRVMAGVKHLPLTRNTQNSPLWAPWIAVVCGFLFGIDGLISFIFSAWITATAN